MTTQATGLFLLIFMLALSAGAVNFDVDACPMWSDGSHMSLSHCAVIKISMENNDYANILGISMPLTFYAYGDVGSWEILGYEGLSGFEAGSSWWILLNEFWTRRGTAWDGQIADTINWSGSGLVGFPPNQPMLPRFKFRIHFPDITTGEVGYFCVDSCSIPNATPSGKYDWLFNGLPASFGGPYCFRVEHQPCLCSDVNSDGGVNLLDVVYLLNYLYYEGPTYQSCFPDFTCTDCAVNILDVVHLLNYLYKGGPKPYCD
ncbi:MAG: hypothetical protein AB1746_02890 [Candidatus Zixiibacteriota bacterium]